MICNTLGLNSNIIRFTEIILEKAKLDYDEAEILDFDLDRIYLKIDSERYSIRMWNIDEKGIIYSVFANSSGDWEELNHAYISRDDYIV